MYFFPLAIKYVEPCSCSGETKPGNGPGLAIGTLPAWILQSLPLRLALDEVGPTLDTYIAVT